MKTHSIFKISLLSVSLLVTLVSTASATSVSLKVGEVESSESSIEVPVLINQCEGLGALQFVISYDPLVVEPVSVESASALSSGLVEFNIKSPGKLGVAIVSSSAVNGIGELLKVIFKPVVGEGKTDLTIADALAWDYENNTEMLISLEAGSLALTGKSGFLSNTFTLDQWKMPIMIGAGCLVLFILIVSFSRRRKKKVADPARNSVKTSGGLFCQKCGAHCGADAQFCPKCGQPVSSVPE